MSVLMARIMENEQLTYVQGQRWVSDAEPELGLGIVLEADAKSIRLVFPASEVERGYSRNSPPSAARDFPRATRFGTGKDANSP